MLDEHDGPGRPFERPANHGRLPPHETGVAPALYRRMREEAEWALTALDASGLAIFRKTQEQGLEALESRGVLHPELVQTLAQHYLGGPLERALEGTDCSATIPKVPNDAETPAHAALRDVSVRAFLAAPLRDDEDGAVVGVLLVAWPDPRARVDSRIVARITAYLTLALAHDRQRRRMERQAAFSELMENTMDALIRDLLEAPDLSDHHLVAIVAKAVTLLDARAGALARLQGDGAAARIVAVHNLPSEGLGLVVPSGEGIIGQVLQSGQPLVLDAEHVPDALDGLCSTCATFAWMAVPIMAKETVQGVLCLAADPPRRFAMRDTATLALFARFAGSFLKVMHLLARARRAAALEQRQVLARDLHDSVTQTVFSLQLAAQVAWDTWEGQPDQAHEALEMVLHLAQGASAEMRTLLFELRENALESEGLGRALERYIDMLRHRTALQIDLRVTWIRDIPAAYAEALYRVVQEALTNVLKHARATQATVTLIADTTRVVLDIVDDGIGFASAEPAFDSYGLVVMRERVSELGGTVRLGNRSEGGASVRVDLPLLTVLPRSD